MFLHGSRNREFPNNYAPLSDTLSRFVLAQAGRQWATRPVVPAAFYNDSMGPEKTLVCCAFRPFATGFAATYTCSFFFQPLTCTCSKMRIVQRFGTSVTTINPNRLSELPARGIDLSVGAFSACLQNKHNMRSRRAARVSFRGQIATLKELIREGHYSNVPLPVVLRQKSASWKRGRCTPHPTEALNLMLGPLKSAKF